MATTHRFHPDPTCGDPESAVLFDNCARCLELADDCLELDSDTLARLIPAAMHGWDHTPTAAEYRAADQLRRALRLAERLTGRPWRELALWQGLLQATPGSLTTSAATTVRRTVSG